MHAAYLPASIEGLPAVTRGASSGVRVQQSKQSLPSVARALAAPGDAEGRGREGYGSHRNTKTGLPDASFRLDPFWKL